MRNSAEVTGGKPIAVLLQSISGVSAINHLVAFYDIHGGKRAMLFFYFVPVSFILQSKLVLEMENTVKISHSEELDKPAVSALGVRSRKLSKFLKGQS
jgi:hypothetical protein